MGVSGGSCAVYRGIRSIALLQFYGEREELADWLVGDIGGDTDLFILQSATRKATGMTGSGGRGTCALRAFIDFYIFFCRRAPGEILGHSIEHETLP